MSTDVFQCDIGDGSLVDEMSPRKVFPHDRCPAIATWRCNAIEDKGYEGTPVCDMHKEIWTDRNLLGASRALRAVPMSVSEEEVNEAIESIRRAHVHSDA